MADKSVALVVKVPSALKEDIQKLANDDQRSVGQYVRIVLTNHVEQKKSARAPYNEE